MTSLRCWVLTDGKAGTENQCLGLAEALGVAADVKRIVPRLPWRLLPPQLWIRALSAAGPGGDALTAPWPDLLIASGRNSVAPAIAIKKASGGGTFTVQIQNPTVSLRRFDVVVVPRHDGLDGDNVVITEGALNLVTAGRLASSADAFRDRFASLPCPLVAVLVGGPNRNYRMTRAAAERLADGLAALASGGAGLAITPSRRTDPDWLDVLRRRLAGLPAYFWDGKDENPYFGVLALADAIIVTSDSVSMVSEACATGKPVHIFHLDGGSPKFERFHRNLQDRGFTRPFSGVLESWTYDPLDDTGRVADEIRRRLADRGHKA